jgi:hypothetical protein
VNYVSHLTCVGSCFVVAYVQMSKRVGRPSGIPRDGGWGTGVKTKTVRVPVAIAGCIKAELAALVAVRSLVADWDARVADACAVSSQGKPSPRYEQALVLLAELRVLIG